MLRGRVSLPNQKGVRGRAPIAGGPRTSGSETPETSIWPPSSGGRHGETMAERHSSNHGNRRSNFGPMPIGSFCLRRTPPKWLDGFPVSLQSRPKGGTNSATNQMRSIEAEVRFTFGEAATIVSKENPRLDNHQSSISLSEFHWLIAFCCFPWFTSRLLLFGGCLCWLVGWLGGAGGQVRLGGWVVG